MNRVIIFLFYILIASCVVKNKSFISNNNLRSCGCDPLWEKSVSKDFVKILEHTTSSNHPIWKDYSFTDGTFVLNAGQINDSLHCLGLWQKGEVISYKCSKDVPDMLTPLYSYYLNYKNIKEIDSVRFGTYKDAPDFASWMRANNIESAIYIPTDFPKLPFEIPALVKAQLAVHEAFHTEVTLRYWYTKEGFWPSWDKQPDVNSVQKCYTYNDTTQESIKEEQDQLANMVEALLDNEKLKAIEHGNNFLNLRESRYQTLKEYKVHVDDSSYINCRDGEALMEIEEGLADYGSWTKMYDTGVASKESLLKRYRANQKAVYYLTGCMLMHASILMNNGDDKDIIEKIVNSKSLKEGNLYVIFKNQFSKFQSM